jgi:hypothetical protein
MRLTKLHIRKRATHAPASTRAAASSNRGASGVPITRAARTLAGLAGRHSIDTRPPFLRLRPSLPQKYLPPPNGVELKRRGVWNILISESMTRYTVELSGASIPARGGSGDLERRPVRPRPREGEGPPRSRRGWGKARKVRNHCERHSESGPLPPVRNCIYFLSPLI